LRGKAKTVKPGKEPRKVAQRFLPQKGGQFFGEVGKGFVGVREHGGSDGSWGWSTPTGGGEEGNSGSPDRGEKRKTGDLVNAFKSEAHYPEGT